MDSSKYSFKKKRTIEGVKAENKKSNKLTLDKPGPSFSTRRDQTSSLDKSKLTRNKKKGSQKPHLKTNLTSPISFDQTFKSKLTKRGKSNKKKDDKFVSVGRSSSRRPKINNLTAVRLPYYLRD